MITVKRIETKGQAVVVQWEQGGEPHRAIVPRTKLSGREISVEELERGIPVRGVDLSALGDQLTVEVADLEKELKRAGIWTLQGVLDNPAVIMGILQRLYGADVAAVQTAAYQGAIE